MNREEKRFCCAAVISMWKWDPEMLCSTSVALRGAFLQRSPVPRLIEITPKGSFKSNSLPHVCSLFFFPLLSTPSLEQRALKCFSRKDSNVIQKKLMWSQGWLLIFLKTPAAAERRRVWDKSSNTTGKLVSEPNKERAGGWGSRLPLLPLRLSQLTLKPLITVQHRVTWQPGPGPGMYTRAEAAVICVRSWSTLYPYFHKHCRTSRWGALLPVLLQLKRKTVPAKLPFPEMSPITTFQTNVPVFCNHYSIFAGCVSIWRWNVRLWVQ